VTAARLTVSRVLCTYVPVAVLALVPAVLALRFGGYHPRHSGWVVLGLALWACERAARGRLSAPGSLAGIATFALLGLTAWTTTSIAWADTSTHAAWVEGSRAAGYAAAFVLGGALLANARGYARFVWMAGAGISLLAVATIVRMLGGAPLTSFVAGRLDWPIGYVPGVAAMYLIGMFLLLGVSVAAEVRWAAERTLARLTISGAALAGAGTCAAFALLAQSRGTIPAVLVAIIATLVATPTRVAWLLRIALIGGALVASSGPIGDVYQSQFAWRQAPFTQGADQGALLTAAEGNARTGAAAILVAAVALGLLGMMLPLLSTALGARLHALRARTGVNPLLPATVLAVALIVGVLALASPGGRSIPDRAREQIDTCLHPPERVNDPGSATSYFATTGTGRCDYYRVALIAAKQYPVAGLGAGNFRGAYVRDRRTGEEPLVTHSLPLQLLSELGFIGAALGATTLVCVVLAMLRFVRSGPQRDPAFAGAIGAIAYWCGHASIDWLWQLPAVSLVPVALAGGLVACVSPGQRRVRLAVAAPVAAGVALAVVAVVLPVTMADSALRRARDPELRTQHPEQALAAARDARRFDPSWAEPSITEGVLQLAAGDREGAAAAGRRAVAAEPRSWSIQYRAAGLIALGDTYQGQRAVLAARALNPRLEGATAATDAAASGDGDAKVPGGPDAGPDSLQIPDA